MGGFGSGRKPGSGGRKPGARNIVTDAMRADILHVYGWLGGKKFLLQWGKENNTEFVRQCLSRVMPAPPREDAEAQPAVIVDQLSMFETARRIAFILASADVQMAKLEDSHDMVDAQPRTIEPPLVEMAPSHEPYRPPQEPQEPPNEAPVVEPPAPMPRSRERIEETIAESIETYRGTASEQGRSHAKPGVDDQRRKAEYILRLAARHRRDLL